MIINKRSIITGLIVLGICHNQVFARGGGAGFHGGSFGGYRGDSFNRGFDHFGSDMGDMHGLNDTYARADAAEHVPAAAEDRNYNWGGAHNLATDSGLANTASQERGGYAHGYYHNLANEGDLVRGAYGYPGVFNSGWWGAHPNAWRYDAWANNSAWGWGATSWPAMAGWWGMPADVAPIPYEYGNNITYQNDTVYYGSQPMASTAAYYEEAQNLAQSEAVASTASGPDSSKEWKPLGVYSLTQGGQTNTNMMFQLAVNKQGAIKGNYFNALTDENKAVTGAVDKKNMRAAWTIGDNKNVVYDTGLANLMKDQSPVLVHMNKAKTQQWNLVRLKQPKKEPAT